MQKRFNALLGLALGICTLPLALVAWPIFLAWFLWNETEDEGTPPDPAGVMAGNKSGT